MLPQFNLVYITLSSPEEAKQIAQYLLEKRLIACANIISSVESIYWWEDKIQNELETVLICKTQQSLVQSIIKEVKSIHSYTCPCIVSFPITEGNPEFFNWIQNETK